MTARRSEHPAPPGTSDRPKRPVAFDDPLTYNVAGLLADPAGTVRELDLHDVAIQPGDDLVATEPLEGHVRLTRTNRGLRIQAQLRTTLAGECRRCLRPVETPVEVTIDDEIRPSIDLHTGQPTPLEEGEDLDTPRLTDHHELELRPLIDEAVALAEPMDVLCEPDCPGLCPECGQRRTEGHAHPSDDIDPRLEALRAFKVDASDDKVDASDETG